MPLKLRSGRSLPKRFKSATWYLYAPLAEIFGVVLCELFSPQTRLEFAQLSIRTTISDTFLNRRALKKVENDKSVT